MTFVGNRAIYIQIAQLLMDKVMSQELKEGERVPSVREIAAQMEVNVNTVVRSFDYLSQRDIIFQRRGLGFFVCEGAKMRVLQFKRNEFFSLAMPQFFEDMRRLGIDIDTIVERYKEF